VRRWLPVHERWWQAGLAANTGAAGFGAAQGFSVRQLLAFAESAVAVADLHLCIFDCSKGEAESTANDLTLVLALCRVVALDGFHRWILAAAGQ